jgi:ATP-dependent 26S proteasome regulatory subunit
VHQVNVPISHVSEAFKPFSTVLIRDGVESVLCETFPDNELETNEIQIHPFTKTLLFDTILSLEPIQTSINATKITLQLHNAEPNAVKSLEHMDKHISNINSLFAKPFNEQWLQPMIRRRLLHQRVVQNAIIPISLSGYNYAFRVTSIEPQTNTAIVDASTELVVNLVKHTEADITEGIQELSLSEDKHVLLWNKVAQQIGGLDEQIQELVTLLDSILLEQIPNIPRTILIHGVQGTGKTLLTKYPQIKHTNM